MGIQTVRIDTMYPTIIIGLSMQMMQ